MTGAVDLAAPPPGVTGWTVAVDMPRFEDGKKVGQLTGWLDSNNPPTTTRQRIEHGEIRRLWRQAAKVAYARARLPRNLDRIFLLVQFQFADARPRDQANFEPTLKPVIDALQRERIVVVRKTNPKTGRVTLDTQTHLGWGVIPNDGDEHLVRGQQQPKLPPLGKHSTVGGRVVLHIIPFPRTTPA